jgi:hypothetical protein
MSHLTAQRTTPHHTSVQNTKHQLKVSCRCHNYTNAGGGGAAESVCPPAHELAWGYDVVITTFQRLSSDWSMRSDPRLAERLVLLKVSGV